MSLNLQSLKEYQTLHDLIRRELSHYHWNQNVLSPKDLIAVCEHKGIEYYEERMGEQSTGYYSVVSGLPRVVVNSDLTTASKWFAMACKIASHFTPEPIRARALGSIALMPTWMLTRYSFEELRMLGYCDQFLAVRQQAWTTFYDVPAVRYAYAKPVAHVSEIVEDT